MNSKLRGVLADIKNTLTLLSDVNLLIYFNSPVIESREGKDWVTWPNHVAGRHNCEGFFGKIEQYRTMLETGAFTCLVRDGSIIRAAYGFDQDGLTNYNLLWWPSPFKITEDDLQFGGPLDLFDIYATDRGWHSEINMRTPIRFDFDLVKGAPDHPISHAHLQDSDCRIFVDRPISFNRFIKFVFKNFYACDYSRYSFWDELHDIKFAYKAKSFPLATDAILGWHN